MAAEALGVGIGGKKDDAVTDHLDVCPQLFCLFIDEFASGR